MKSCEAQNIQDMLLITAAGFGCLISVFLNFLLSESPWDVIKNNLWTLICLADCRIIVKSRNENLIKVRQNKTHAYQSLLNNAFPQQHWNRVLIDWEGCCLFNLDANISNRQHVSPYLLSKKSNFCSVLYSKFLFSFITNPVPEILL